jgi:hypothetical protein
VRGWRAGRRAPAQIPLRRALGPFFAPVIAIAVVTAILIAGIGIRYAFYTSPDQAAVNDAPRITDTAFEHAAAAVCSHYVGVFNTASTLSQDPTAGQSGAFLDGIATAFDAMVVQLSALPVAPTDRAQVDSWLADWRTYDAYGHQYASAVRNGAERDLVRNDVGRIDAILRRRNGFAQANHMGSCVFH